MVGDYNGRYEMTWLFKIPYFRKAAIAYAFSTKRKPNHFDKLTFMFRDTEGRGYYTFGDDFDLFIARKGWIDTKLIEMSAGLTGEEIGKLADAMIKALNGGNKPEFSMIGHLAHEIKLRQEIIIHPEIFYDLVALYYVREDEDPAVVDFDVHNEKVEYFKSSKDMSFFFANSTLTGLLPWLKSMEGSLRTLLKDTGMEVKALRKQVEDYLSAEKRKSKDDSTKTP